MKQKSVKRIVSILCVVTLLLTAPTKSYARANSFEINSAAETIVIGGLVVSTETALGWALSLLGFTAAAQVVYENRDSWISWCNTQFDRLHNWFDARVGDLYVTWEQMQKWLNDVANGAMDTSSDCYNTFLDYCTDLAKSITSAEDSSGSGLQRPEGYFSQTSFNIYECALMTNVSGKSNFLDQYPWIDGWSYEWVPLFISASSSWIDDGIYFTASYKDDCRYDEGEYSLRSIVNLYYYDRVCMFCPAFGETGGTYSMYYLEDGKVCKNGVSATLPYSSMQSGLWISDMLMFTDMDAVKNFLQKGEIDWNSVISLAPTGWTFDGTGKMVRGTGLPWDGVGESISGVFGDVGDIIVAPDTSGVIERDGNLDNVGVADATGTIVGVISIPVEGIDGIEGLDAVSKPYTGVEGVYPIDVVGGVILGTDIPIDEITPGVVPSVNGEYTINGLQELFPFCIPWDLKALFTTLSATPKAPSFKIPMPVPQKGSTIYNLKFEKYYIEGDLSDFDDVARVLRVMELLAFCVALTLVTRKLIRG